MPIDQHQWSVLLKGEMADGREISPADLERLIDAIPYPRRTINGGGRDFTATFYVPAPDPAEAIRMATDALRTAARALSLPTFAVIRVNTTSPERRVTGYRGVAARRGRHDAWSVLVTYEPSGARSAGPDQLRAIADALPEDSSVVARDDRFAGAPGAIVVRFWVDASDPGSAATIAGETADAALADAGLTGWTAARVHVASVEERVIDTRLEPPAPDARLVGPRA